jgi:hypothetical protein
LAGTGAGKSFDFTSKTVGRTALIQIDQGCMGSSFIGLQLMGRLGGLVLGHRPASVVRKAVTAG